MLRNVVCAPDEKIYATCVNKKNAKVFYAKTLSAMWDHMQAQPRHHSEVIRDAPCHMYFDFDDGDVYKEWGKMKRMLDRVMKTLGIQLEYVVLDASLGTKRSLHVIAKSYVIINGVRTYKYLLKSPVQGLYLLYRLKDMFGQLPLLDTCIYTRNRCFRMLGCSKYGQRRPFRGPWTMEFWTKTLVQPGTLDAHELGLKHAVSAPMRTLEFPDCVHDVFEWADVSDYRWKVDMEWIFKGHLNKGVCNLAGRQHKNNNRYAIYNCADPSVFTIGCHRCRKRYSVSVPPRLYKAVRRYMNTKL